MVLIRYLNNSAILNIFPQITEKLLFTIYYNGQWHMETVQELIQPVAIRGSNLISLSGGGGSEGM